MSNPYINLSDENLMILYQQGEHQAFEVIYSRYKSKIYSFLSKRVAEESSIDDVFQSIFMKLHKTRQHYNSDHLAAKWIYIICRSELNDFYRKSKRKNRLEQEFEITNSVLEPHDRRPIDIEEFVIDKELNTKEREALKLRYKEDLEFQEIGRRLNVTESSSRKIISRAIGKLKSIYGRSYE